VKSVATSPSNSVRELIGTLERIFKSPPADDDGG